MSLTTIVRKSAPWNRDTMYRLMNVGFTEEFQLHPPMERAKSRSASKEQMDRFARRQAMTLWPWQDRCSACGNVREKKQLQAHGGRCEKCRPSEGVAE